MRKCNDEIYQQLKKQRFRPFCLCLPDVMFVTRGSKNSLFFVFDFRLLIVPCYLLLNKELPRCMYALI